MNSIAKDEIHEALTLLELAAKDATIELWTLIKDQYPYLEKKLIDNIDYFRDSLDSVQQRAREKANRIKEISEEKMKEATSRVEAEVHHHPWCYISGAAVSALLLGYILGRKSGS